MQRQHSRSPAGARRHLRKSKSPIKVVEQVLEMSCHPRSDANLHLALELAEKHRLEAELLRDKHQALQKQNSEKAKRIEQLESQLAERQALNEKHCGKYRKLKEKYRTLKKSERPGLSKENADPNDPDKPSTEKAPPKYQIEVQPNIEQFQRELDHRERIIKHLSQEVDECEENTVNVLRLVEVLEQRIQELAMENSLLRGMLRERSYQTTDDASD